MKKLLIAMLVTGMFASCSETSKGSKGSGNVKLKNGVDTLSYCLGINIGGNVKQLKTDLNYDLLNAGIQAIVNDEDPKFTPQEAGQLLNMMAQKLYAASIELNKKAGEELLEKNKSNSNITTTESGLQYEIITSGSGPIPTVNDKVLCHYKGSMADGTVFQSSYDAGEPIEFQVTGVIPGWTEALQLMTVGSKWKIYLPSELAYGERPPRGSDIMPGSMLIFEMELLEIVSGTSSEEPGFNITPSAE